MRTLAILAATAVLSIGFNVATSFEADAAGKKRMSKNYCPPMTVVRR